MKCIIITGLHYAVLVLHAVVNIITIHYKIHYQHWFTLRIVYVTRSVKQYNKSL